MITSDRMKDLKVSQKDLDLIISIKLQAVFAAISSATALITAVKSVTKESRVVSLLTELQREIAIEMDAIHDDLLLEYTMKRSMEEENDTAHQVPIQV